MNKSNKTSLFKSSLMAALFACAFHSHAAGLGKLTVYSAIGQPLNAELALSASPDELPSLSAKLASNNAFRDAGVDFVPALTGMRFNVVKSSTGQPVIRLYTDNPLNEPFLHFLVELNWATGKVVREYTFLLDPADIAKPATVEPVAAPAVPVGMAAPQVSALPPPPPAAQVSQSQSPQAATSPAPKGKDKIPQTPLPASQTPTEKSGGMSEYHVKAGDTLGKIARETKVDNVSLDQMLVALFNGNRDAFEGGNMNRLRAGKILRVPDAAEVAMVSAVEARKLVVAQSSDFNAYRRRLADAANNAPVTTAPSQQESSGKIKPQVEAKAGQTPVQDKLEVSRTEAAKAVKPSGVHALEEELVARERSLREASERIAKLEKNLENLKQLVEIKSQGGAQLQQQVKQSASQVAPSSERKTEVAPSDKSIAPQPVATPADKPVVAEKVLADAESAVKQPAGENVEPLAKAPESSTAVPQDKEAATDTLKPESSAPLDKAAPPPAKPISQPVPEAEASFTDENPEVLFGGIGLIALLLGVAGYNTWQKKRVAKPPLDNLSASLAVSDIDQEHSALVAPVSASVSASSAQDVGEISILEDFSESGALTTEESVDPVAEADVLLAYGREAQAEEILQEGMKNDPTRPAIHLKLLELYARRRDQGNFDVVLERLRELTNGRGDEWEQALALSREVHVSNAPEESTGAKPVESDGVQAASISKVTTELPRAESAEMRKAGSTVILESSPLATSDESAASLDFDLDLGTTSAPAAASVDAVPVAAAEEVMSLDFDFDLDQPEKQTDIAAEVEVAPSAEPAEIDFSLDLGAETSEGQDVGLNLNLDGSNEASNQDSLGEVDVDFDVDLGVASDQETASLSDAPEEQHPEALDLDDVGFDLGSVAEPTPVALQTNEESVSIVETPESDFDFDLDLDVSNESSSSSSAPIEASAPSVEIPDLDLSLDVPELEADSSVRAGTEPDLGLDVAEQFSAQNAANNDQDDPEVDTKLELAQAYEEMGDREGACELLQEVLNEGSQAQRALAKARLDELSV